MFLVQGNFKSKVNSKGFKALLFKINKYYYMNPTTKKLEELANKEIKEKTFQAQPNEIRLKEYFLIDGKISYQIRKSKKEGLWELINFA